MTYTLRQGECGTDFVVTSAWSASVGDAFRSSGASFLTLNHALGFVGDSVNFLEGLDVLRLEVIAPNVDDLSPVSSIGTELRHLVLQTSSNVRLDLRDFPSLRSLSVDKWSTVADTVDQLPHLQRLYAGHFAADDLEVLAGLGSKLTWLSLKDRPHITSLRGLQSLPALRVLNVVGGRLRSLDDLDPSGSSLSELRLESNRGIENIDALHGCGVLQFLNLADCGRIADLRGLSGCVQLRQLHLYESTNIADGDLTPIVLLPALEELRIQDRRHYHPRVKDIRSALAKGTDTP